MPASIPLVRPEQSEEHRRSTMPTRLRRRLQSVWGSIWFRVVILGLAGISVHSPALQGQRIWDDQYLSRDNPFIKSPYLLLEVFRHHLFLDSYSAHYRPVQNISYMFDYYFWNTDEFGFHLTNTLLHAGSGILLFLLLRHLLASFFFPKSSIALLKPNRRRSSWIKDAAFLISLLWTVHPVHSAAVDYISGRADSLAFFFAAASWLLFLQGESVQRLPIRLVGYGLAAASGLLALLSREIACVWIILFIGYLLWIEKRIAFRRRLAAIICSILLVASYAGLRQLPAERPSGSAQAGWTAPVRATLMARALGDYARLMTLPINLHMERTVVDAGSWRTNADWRTAIGDDYLSILGLITLSLFAYGACWKGSGQRLRIFGACWFFIGYLPISNLFQLNATVAEHWLYLPSVGFLLFLAGCAIELPVSYRRLTISVTLVAVLGLACRSFVRSSDWNNEETFYKRTLAAGGISGRVAGNLAQVYVRHKNYGDAEKILRRLVQAAPDYPTGRNTLAALLNLQGKKTEAEALFASTAKMAQQARHDYPRTWGAALSLAQLRHQAKDDTAALRILDQARSDYPEVWELICFEAEVLREARGPDPALELIQTFASHNWWHHDAAFALGRLYAQKDDVEHSEAELRLASRLDVHDAESLRFMALMRLNQKRMDEAVQFQRLAIARQPDEPSQYVLLSNILEQMGRNEEAR
ncbi:MAG TPA: tetratricopeptide repeat protein, partial [Chthoniobacterales bacterium]|nr:tetratricopeptide repeat protein [Chthoniobacterales bacterium]